MATTGPMGDYEGNTITVGDQVTATAYGYGTPSGTGIGHVVGFTTRGNVKVRWDSQWYDGHADAYHTSRPTQIRLVKKKA